MFDCFDKQPQKKINNTIKIKDTKIINYNDYLESNNINYKKYQNNIRNKTPEA